MKLDATDRQIIAATQRGLPLVPEPYKAVADEVGLSETALLDRLARSNPAVSFGGSPRRPTISGSA